MWLADLFDTSQSKRYFDLLVRQATILAEAVQALSRYYETGDRTCADAVARLGKAGDDTLQQLVKAIRDSFITPLDRQDLYYLGDAMEDMLDYVESAAIEFELFDLASTPAMRSMCAALVSASAEVEMAMQSLAAKPADAYAHGRAASAVKDQVEDMYRQALAALFAGDDSRTIFKAREIYHHLKDSADRVDRIGKVIAKIVVKTT
jgi:uncharacterized protein